jgi:multiple sugar transport system ATP-binding protein
MLELRSLHKKFDNLVAVNGLNLTCRDREFLVIFGPAGAGKSTTLRLIANVLPPTSGEIYLDGRAMNQVPPELRNMSMVFENYALYSHKTVFENLAFPLRARKCGEEEIRRRAQEMAEVLQITHLLERRPGFLSGGQRQRVALGRTMIREAEVYLLDEPISHLDAKLRNRMRGELKAICSKKQAKVVHVTHDYREAMALSDRVAVLNRGRLMQLDVPDEIYHHPANEFVASYFGDPPMSFLDVELARESGQALFRVIGNGFQVPARPELVRRFESSGAPKRLRLGIRATDITVSPTADEKHTLPGEVFVTERLGFRNILIVQAGGAQIRVCTPPGQAYTSRQPVMLNINQGNVHVFADGKAVAHPNAVKPQPDVQSPEG